MCTCINTEQEPKCLQERDHLVSLNVEPSYGHDERHHSKDNLEGPVGWLVGLQEEEESQRENKSCRGKGVRVSNLIQVCVAGKAMASPPFAPS